MRKEWILLLLLALTGLIYHKKMEDKHPPTQAAPWVQPPIINIGRYCLLNKNASLDGRRLF